MPETLGLNHLGLAVSDLEATTQFFTQCLGWEESGLDESYPRTSVSDGAVRLTLWQVDKTLTVEPFNRRKNVGLHHLAISVQSEDALNTLHKRISSWKGVQVEFSPELVGNGPRQHMMLSEPSGIRLELIWSGETLIKSGL